MKLQKSSYSLHSSPKSSGIFKEATNTINYRTPHRFFAKTRATHSTSSSAMYNARSKIANISQQMDKLEMASKQMMQTNKELKLQLHFFQEEYENRQLKQLTNQLSLNLKELKRDVIIRQRSDLLKYQSLNQMVNNLWKGHRQTHKKVQQIECKILRLEQIMGSVNPLDQAEL